MTYIEKLEEVMKNRKITAKEICKNTNIKEATFSAWRKGSKPNIESFIKVLQFLNIDLNNFFESNIFDFNQGNELNDDEKELIELFRKLPMKEQFKVIGVIEEKISKLSTGKSLNSQEEKNKIS